MDLGSHTSGLPAHQSKNRKDNRITPKAPPKHCLLHRKIAAAIRRMRMVGNAMGDYNPLNDRQLLLYGQNVCLLISQILMPF